MSVKNCRLDWLKSYHRGGTWYCVMCNNFIFLTLFLKNWFTYSLFVDWWLSGLVCQINQHTRKTTPVDPTTKLCKLIVIRNFVIFSWKVSAAILFTLTFLSGINWKLWWYYFIFYFLSDFVSDMPCEREKHCQCLIFTGLF